MTPMATTTTTTMATTIEDGVEDQEDGATDEEEEEDEVHDRLWSVPSVIVCLTTVCGSRRVPQANTQLFQTVCQQAIAANVFTAHDAPKTNLGHGRLPDKTMHRKLVELPGNKGEDGRRMFSAQELIDGMKKAGLITFKPWGPRIKGQKRQIFL